MVDRNEESSSNLLHPLLSPWQPHNKMAPVFGRHGNNPYLSQRLRSVPVLTSDWNRDTSDWNRDGREE